MVGHQGQQKAAARKNSCPCNENLAGEGRTWKEGQEEAGKSILCPRAWCSHRESGPKGMRSQKGLPNCCLSPPRACPRCGSSCRGHCGSAGTPCPSCTGMAQAGGRVPEAGSICLAPESAVTSPARPQNQDGPLRAGTGHFKG